MPSVNGHPRLCSVCSGPIVGRHPRWRVCSEACRRERERARQRAYSGTRVHPRRERPRPRTINKQNGLRRKHVARLDPLELAELAESRPRTRSDCEDGPRPCPWVGCAHHLYLDVNPRTGSIKINFPDLEPWEMNETCSLDVADRNGITLEEVGATLNLTRERVRQIEGRALGALIRRERGEAEIP